MPNASSPVSRIEYIYEIFSLACIQFYDISWLPNSLH